MAKKINEKMKEIKKDLLLKEASMLFETVGYENMKISNLAKNAGVSQSTIYTIFVNKEGLYLEYIRYHIKGFMEELSGSITPNSTNRDKIEAFIRLKFSYYIQKEKALQHTLKNNPLFFNTLYNDFNNPFDEVYEFLANTFKQFDSSLDDTEAMKRAYALSGYSDGYISFWMVTKYIDLFESVHEVCTTFLATLKVDTHG
jgi:AcrR family transcriptional regulator